MQDPLVTCAVQVATNKQEIERLTRLVDSCNNDRNQLKSDIDSCNKELDTLDEQLEKLTKRRDEQEEVFTDLTALLITKNKILSESRKALAAEKQKQEHLKNELRRLACIEDFPPPVTPNQYVGLDEEHDVYSPEHKDCSFGATSPAAQNSPTDTPTKLESGDMYCCALCYATMACIVTGREMSDSPVTDTVVTTNPRRRKAALKNIYCRDIMLETPIEELPIQRRELYCFNNPLYVMEQYMDICFYKISMQDQDKMEHVCRLLFLSCDHWLQHLQQHLPDYTKGDLRDIGIVPSDWDLKSMICNWQLKQNNTDAPWFQGDDKEPYRKLYNSLYACVKARKELPAHEFSETTFFNNQSKRQRQ